VSATEAVCGGLTGVTAAPETGGGHIEALTSEGWQMDAQWLQGGGDREPFWAEAQ
jgi:hypothetical protein